MLRGFERRLRVAALGRIPQTKVIASAHACSSVSFARAIQAAAIPIQVLQHRSGLSDHPLLALG